MSTMDGQPRAAALICEKRSCFTSPPSSTSRKTLPVEIMVGIGVLGIVMGVLAAILPARRAAKLDPLTAISYE